MYIYICMFYVYIYISAVALAKAHPVLTSHHCTSCLLAGNLATQLAPAPEQGRVHLHIKFLLRNSFFPSILREGPWAPQNTLRFGRKGVHINPPPGRARAWLAQGYVCLWRPGSFRHRRPLSWLAPEQKMVRTRAGPFTY